MHQAAGLTLPVVQAMDDDGAPDGAGTGPAGDGGRPRALHQPQGLHLHSWHGPSCRPLARGLCRQLPVQWLPGCLSCGTTRLPAASWPCHRLCRPLQRCHPADAAGAGCRAGANGLAYSAAKDPAAAQVDGSTLAGMNVELNRVLDDIKANLRLEQKRVMELNFVLVNRVLSPVQVPCLRLCCSLRG